MSVKMQVFTFLFLMLGPFKIIAPFMKITRNATPAFARQMAIRATLFSTITLIIAGILGQRIIGNYGIPIPILALSGGIILFLVALLNIIKQFEPPSLRQDTIETPTLSMAINPLAFPAIVTPYGIAALIVFMSVSPDLNSKLIVGATVLGIMVLNLAVMLVSRYIYRQLSVILALLGVILGVIQVALGLMIIVNQTKAVLAL